MSNPIHVLMDHFFSTLERIAPENSNDLRDILNQLNLSFELKDREDSFFFYCDPSTKTITAGTGALGRLWATAFGYYCLYSTVADAKRRNVEIRELNLKDHERMRQASTLLEWVLNVEYEIAEANKQGKPLPSFDWPTELPCPIKNPPKLSDLQVADELFLCAGAFILHHEFAHLRLSHIPSDDSTKMREIENEADFAAAEWILSGIDEDDDKFLKRAIGVALALSWLTAIAVFIPEDQQNHPPSCDRLFTVIDNFVSNSDHLVWAFVGTILRANMEARKMDYDKERKATSFKDDVEYCISVFKKYQAK